MAELLGLVGFRVSDRVCTVHQENQWHRDWVRHLKARSEKAAEVAQLVSLALPRAYKMLDEAVEAVHIARARTAAARARTARRVAGESDGTRPSPDRVHQRPAAPRDLVHRPPELQVSGFHRNPAFRVFPFDEYE